MPSVLCFLEQIFLTRSGVGRSVIDCHVYISVTGYSVIAKVADLEDVRPRRCFHPIQKSSLLRFIRTECKHATELLTHSDGSEAMTEYSLLHVNVNCR